jgi:hypothetical protein
MLGRQLPILPPFDSFWAELSAFFDWLEGKVAPIKKTPYRLAEGDELIQVPLGGLAGIGLRGTPVETIRFAAANHLCVELDYVDMHGVRSTRVIEPYSLRRTHTGDVHLHAERADGGGHRQYNVARILSARATKRGFVPQHRLELTPRGYQPIPAAVVPARSRTTSAVPERRWTRTATYVYQCSVCHRHFQRKRPTTRLKAHKDTRGYPCRGRTAMLVTTK